MDTVNEQSGEQSTVMLNRADECRQSADECRRYAAA
jgi:hypothetical protein